MDVSSIDDTDVLKAVMRVDDLDVVCIVDFVVSASKIIK